MKVLFFTAYTRWSPHWETELELMQRHLDAGDEVIQLYCDGSLMACDDNPFHRKDICLECMGRRVAGLTKLSRPITSRPFLALDRAARRQIHALPKLYTELRELKKVRFENYDLGFSVMSSLISAFRNTDIPLTELGNLAARFIVAGLTTYRSLQRYLAKHPVDRVYVFNGRFTHSRAVLRACQNLKIPCFVHERGHDLSTFGLYENTYAQDLRYVSDRIRALWQAAEGCPERSKIAERFFLDRARGATQWWYSFVTGQKPGLLPAGWDYRKRNVVIFNSSEDEYAALDEEWENPIYKNQQEGLERIIAAVEADPRDLHLYLRVHPNLRGLKNAQTDGLSRLKARCLTTIPPDDPVSTYALIQNADKVLTFGSTVGIEAVFWGKPSILAGRSFYQDLGGTYNPETHEELVSLLYQNLPPKDKTAAYMYGYYFGTFGIPYKYYQPTGVGSGKYRGETIQARPSLSKRLRQWCRQTRERVYALQTRLRVLHHWRLS